MTKLTTPGQQVILNSGITQQIMMIPEGGLLVRLNVDGQRLKATFENGTEQPGHSLQILTWALEKLQVDPILDKHNPYDPYNPGIVGRVARAVRAPETSETDAPQAAVIG